MRASINLGRIAGIAIGLHYSWLLIATLITLSLASHFRATNPDWAVTVIWVCAVVTALLFFVTLLAHELSHAVVAKSRGLPVRSITLFALGGIAQIEKDAGSAKTEFWMGIAGPITSLVIGFACLGAALAMGWSVEGSAPGPLAAILGWLGSINVILAVFNLIPGYPLDGGRVLRAILWGMSGDVDRATRNAASVGQVVAGIFIVFGLLRFFGGAGFGGLWLAFIGWFLLDAARASYAEVAVMASLRGVRAGDVMARDCDTIDASTALDAFVDRLLQTGRRCFMVTRDGGEIVGLITPHEVRAVDRSRWPEVRVADAMRALKGLRTVSPATPVTEALKIMSREDVNQLPVVADGRLAGVITRSHVLRLIQTRAELNL
jgi:Zn-dependent protease/predicted transcriptional regulator